MTREMYRYRFDDCVPFEDVESSFLLAVFAAESLYGEAQVRLDAAHAADAERRSFVVDADTPVGRDLNRLFVGFLQREFASDLFRVERVVGTRSVEACREPLAAAG